MNYTTEAAADRAAEQARECCLQHATWMWAQDDVLLAGVDRRPIPTTAIDQLPPWRARMCVQVALRAGATMQHGDLDQLRDTAVAVGGSAPPGWWRAALGLPPEEPRPPARTNQGTYHPPAGWKVVTAT